MVVLLSPVGDDATRLVDGGKQPAIEAAIAKDPVTVRYTRSAMDSQGQASGRTELRGWDMCGTAVLPRLTGSIYPLIGLLRERSLTSLLFEPRGRQGI